MALPLDISSYALAHCMNEPEITITMTCIVSAAALTLCNFKLTFWSMIVALWLFLKSCNLQNLNPEKSILTLQFLSFSLNLLFLATIYDSSFELRSFQLFSCNHFSSTTLQLGYLIIIRFGWSMEWYYFQSAGSLLLIEILNKWLLERFFPSKFVLCGITSQTSYIFVSIC